jgi:hypothetical protein
MMTREEFREIYPDSPGNEKYRDPSVFDKPIVCTHPRIPSKEEWTQAINLVHQRK